MAGENDEIDEIAHLWKKAQQHPRGPARPSHYTYLRGDLVAWLCDWWDLLGNWTLSGYLTNAAALAIEYCDNFHALEFDNCYEWTWGNTFEEKRDRSCCVMFVCAHLALKNSGPYVHLETYPYRNLKRCWFDGVPNSWDGEDLEDVENAEVVGEKRKQEEQQKEEGMPPHAKKPWRAVPPHPHKLLLNIERAVALERVLLNKLEWRLNVVTTLGVVGAFWARGIFLADDSRANDWPITPKFKAVVLKYVGLLIEVSQARGLDRAYGALVCGAGVLMCGRILTGMAPASFNVPVQDLMGCDERDADAVKASLIGCTDDLLAFWHKLLAVGEQLTFTASGAKKRAPTCRQAHYQALWLRQREVQDQLERLGEEDDGLEV